MRQDFLCRVSKAYSSVYIRNCEYSQQIPDTFAASCILSPPRVGYAHRMACERRQHLGFCG
jgi:hypothetical protein